MYPTLIEAQASYRRQQIIDDYRRATGRPERRPRQRGTSWLRREHRPARAA